MAALCAAEGFILSIMRWTYAGCKAAAADAGIAADAAAAAANEHPVLMRNIHCTAKFWSITRQ